MHSDTWCFCAYHCSQIIEWIYSVKLSQTVNPFHTGRDCWVLIKLSCLSIPVQLSQATVETILNPYLKRDWRLLYMSALLWAHNQLEAATRSFVPTFSNCLKLLDWHTCQPLLELWRTSDTRNAVEAYHRHWQSGQPILDSVTLPQQDSELTLDRLNTAMHNQNVRRLETIDSWASDWC